MTCGRNCASSGSTVCTCMPTLPASACKFSDPTAACIWSALIGSFVPVPTQEEKVAPSPAFSNWLIIPLKPPASLSRPESIAAGSILAEPPSMLPSAFLASESKSPMVGASVWEGLAKSRPLHQGNKRSWRVAAENPTRPRSERPATPIAIIDPIRPIPATLDLPPPPATLSTPQPFLPPPTP